MTPRKLHHAAMEFYDQVRLLRVHGAPNSETLPLLRKALNLEAQAADLLKDKFHAEPTRSILYRSAANIAIECKEFRRAEILACEGLIGSPPYVQQEELREVLERANFRRHLELKNIHLQHHQLQMSLTGPMVEAGLIEYRSYTNRLEASSRMLRRQYELDRKQRYQKSGGRPGKEPIPAVFASMPRAASYAITLQLGVPVTQMLLPGMDSNVFDKEGRVIDHVLECLELFENYDIESLEDRIPEKSYLQSFLGTASVLAPDGKNISAVGFTVLRDGAERSVQLTRTGFGTETNAPEEEIDPETMLIPDEDGMIDLRGILQVADGSKKTDRAGVRIPSGTVINFQVPEGLDDTVGILYKQMVRVKAKVRGKKLISYVATSIVPI